MSTITASNREDKVLKNALQIIRKHLNPSQNLLFGSRAKGTFTKGSDFDIAVDVKKPEINIRRKISDEIEGSCGLYNVDIVYLEGLDKNFKSLILEQGKLIYGRN